MARDLLLKLGREWIGTISSWPAEFEYRDAADVGIALSKRLREPDGDYRCDLVIALTHARVPNVCLIHVLCVFMG